VVCSAGRCERISSPLMVQGWPRGTCYGQALPQLRTWRQQFSKPRLFFRASWLIFQTSAALVTGNLIMRAWCPVGGHGAELAGGRKTVVLDSVCAGQRCTSRVRQMAMSTEPPTVVAPPEVSNGPATSEAEWAECLVQYADAASPADAQEVWVFRKRDYSEFQRLIGLRLSYRRPRDQQENIPVKYGQARREEAMAGTKVTCRDRSVDPDLVCAECVRVFTGGAYEDRGISVPAYPPQRDVMNCLALSVGEDNEVAVGKDEAPLRQTAFCNYVNVRFQTIDA